MAVSCAASPDRQFPVPERLQAVAWLLFGSRTGPRISLTRQDFAGILLAQYENWARVAQLLLAAG